jgi:hypothetical protein
LAKLKFLAQNNYETIHSISDKVDGQKRKKLYEAKIKLIILDGNIEGSSKEAFLVFGEAANKPFSKITNLDKEVLEKIEEYLNGKR